MKLKTWFYPCQIFYVSMWVVLGQTEGKSIDKHGEINQRLQTQLTPNIGQSLTNVNFVTKKQSIQLFKVKHKFPTKTLDLERSTLNKPTAISTMSTGSTTNDITTLKHGRLKKKHKTKRSVIINVTSLPVVYKRLSPLYNFTLAEIVSLKQHFDNLSLQKQIDVDARWASLVMIVIILVLMVALWYTGLCRTRKESAFLVVDFVDSQPLTTVKDAVLKKSRYLPMFKQFYSHGIDRATNTGNIW